MQVITTSLATSILLVGLGCTCDSETRPIGRLRPEGAVCPRASERARDERVSLGGIPKGWRADVDAAVKRIPMLVTNPVFAVEEEIVRGADGDKIIFTLYENGDDAAHRLGTYKLGRNRVLHMLNECGGDGRTEWLPIGSTRF